MSSSVTKSSSTLGQSAGVGAGGGAAVGALTTLFSDNPSLRNLLKNVLIGGAGGAAIGSGVHALGNAGDTQVAPSESAPPVAPPIPTPKPGSGKMNLGIAALSGLAPLGIGAAIHGGVSQGPGQAVASGGAALAPSLLVTLIQTLRKKPALTPGTRAVSTAGSVLAAMGAAHAGNKLREN